MPPKTTGPVFSRDALVFLNFSSTTRGDVVASLGTPLIEVQNPGVLVYVSETTRRSWDFVPIILPDLDNWGEDSFPKLNNEPASAFPPLTVDTYQGVNEGPTTEKALFVAYDEHGHVFAHKICAVNRVGLLSASAQWRRDEGKKHKT